MQVQIPQGLQAGMTFQMQMPSAPQPVMGQPMQQQQPMYQQQQQQPMYQQQQPNVVVQQPQPQTVVVQQQQPNVVVVGGGPMYGGGFYGPDPGMAMLGGFAGGMMLGGMMDGGDGWGGDGGWGGIGRDWWPVRGHRPAARDAWTR